MHETLTHRTVKNSFYSLIGFVLPLVLSFLATPVIIQRLGSARFGFLTLLNTMLTVFSLLDFGISYSLTQQLSANRNGAPSEDLNKTFSTTVILYAFIGIILCCLLVLLPNVFIGLFKIPYDFVSSYRLAFVILGLIFLIKMITIPFAQVAFALQRLDIVVIVGLMGNIFLQLGSVAVLKTGHGILSLLVIQLFTATFLLLANYWSWKKVAPALSFKFVFPKLVAQTIGKQGFWIFFSNTMTNILGQFDKFVLGAVWGPAAVGYYATSQMIPEKISGTSFSLSHTFFPIFSEAANSRKDQKILEIKKIFRRGLGIIPVITAGLTVLVLLFGYNLIKFWVSQDFADQTFWAVKFLAITYFLLGFNSFFNSFLTGLQALKFLAFSGMIVALTDVIFMIFLIPIYKINGAAFAYMLSGIPVLFFLYYIERKYFYSQAGDIVYFYGKLFLKIFAVSVITYILAHFVLLPFVDSLLKAVTLGGLTFIIYLTLFWIFNFYTPEDRSLIKNYKRKFIKFI